MELVDLDQSPELVVAAHELFQKHIKGRDAVLCGFPEYIGIKSPIDIYEQTSGVLIACDKGEVKGVLALCPYSNEQLTFWGPVTKNSNDFETAKYLLQTAKSAMSEGGFESLRTQVDIRNRPLRSFFLSNGCRAWKDNVFFELDMSLVDFDYDCEICTREDDIQLKLLITQAFPETGHIDVSLFQREEEGFVHYKYTDDGRISGMGVVKRIKDRSWISLIGVEERSQGKGIATKLLTQIISNEKRRGSKKIALEVLADNAQANRLYVKTGFMKKLQTTILAGPV